MKKTPIINVIGGGLAGSEAAYQIASLYYHVRLFEMRPIIQTGAHVTGDFGELVCSNSLGSTQPHRAQGILKNELRSLNSLLLRCAEQCALPAGGALAVDRRMFSRMVTQTLEDNFRITIIREEVQELPTGPTIIATGPLTSKSFSEALTRFTGQYHIYFYDAIAPIVSKDSIDMEIAYRASRYHKSNEEQGDYINCPLSKKEYDDFVDGLIRAERIPIKDFEKFPDNEVITGQKHYFEGCLPIEVLATRGIDALAFGPMRPTGLANPNSTIRPHAVLQLRQDNVSGDLYNMVGFQTNLTYPEQKKVFRMIPGLENAEFLRYGQMHRNTFINSPQLINPTMQSKTQSELFFAGQITGVEGYAGNIGTGLLAGLNVVRYLKGDPLLELPKTTILGALCYYIAHASPGHFQPMKANLGLLPPTEEPTTKGRPGRWKRAEYQRERAERDLAAFIKESKLNNE
jgi:methylenetetrahydrofolate--tRNA-(uracil-5-)-methyltransferase